MNDEIMNNLNEKLDEALERGRQMLDEEELQHYAEDLKVHTEQIIKEHPLKSLTTGLVVGFLLGRMFSSDE